MGVVGCARVIGVAGAATALVLAACSAFSGEDEPDAPPASADAATEDAFEPSPADAGTEGAVVGDAGTTLLREDFSGPLGSAHLWQPPEEVGGSTVAVETFPWSSGPSGSLVARGPATVAGDGAIRGRIESARLEPPPGTKMVRVEMRVSLAPLALDGGLGTFTRLAVLGPPPATEGNEVALRIDNSGVLSFGITCAQGATCPAGVDSAARPGEHVLAMEVLADVPIPGQATVRGVIDGKAFSASTTGFPIGLLHLALGAVNTPGARPAVTVAFDDIRVTAFPAP